MLEFLFNLPLMVSFFFCTQHMRFSFWLVNGFQFHPLTDCHGMCMVVSLFHWGAPIVGRDIIAFQYGDVYFETGLARITTKLKL